MSGANIEVDDHHRLRRRLNAVRRLSIPNEVQEQELIPTRTSTLQSSFSSTSSPDLSSLLKQKKPKDSTTRSYQYIQLEKSLKSSDLLDKYNDRYRFHQNYLKSIRENRIDDYLKQCYHELDQRKKMIDEERRQKSLRTFTFVDLEERFLSQDPTEDVHIVFVDDPTGLKAIRSTTLLYENYAMKHAEEKEYSIDVESFYRNECDRAIVPSPRARDQITLFARDAAENLQRYLPHLPRVPHRVTIVDQRDQMFSTKQSKFNERQIQQKQHRLNLNQIYQRRLLLAKMIDQSKKNQQQMKQSLEQLWKRDQQIHSLKSARSSQ